MGVPYAEVIGDPVGHSRSPLIHGHWLRKLGIAAEYRRTHVRAEELADFLRQRREDPDWRGCNVTVPHKEAVIPHLDRLDDGAAGVGAVNCIVPEAGGLTGYNSDVDGVAAALAGTPLEGAKAAVIGGGGGARAALTCLARSSVREVAIVVRKPEKAEPLRRMAGPVVIGSFESAAALLAGSAIIINASPLGMTGCPAMPQDLVAAVAQAAPAALFDMVYSPLETAFLAAGRGPRINGLTMLVGQAARAFELFYGTPAPAADDALFELLAS